MPLVTLATSQETGRGSSSYPYEIIELPLRPLTIGPSTWVAGITADQHAAVWSAVSGLYRIPLPAEYSFSESTGVNSSGEAVGTASSGDYSRRVAFLWREKKLSLLPGGQSSATAISENGEIVGQAIYPGAKATAPVLWKGNSIIDLHVCCAGIARGINQKNVIIGDTYDPQGRYHAFLWRREGGEHLLSVPGEQYSSALALNSRGDILLSVTPGGVFLYTGSERHELGISKASARAMNRGRIVVGSFGPNPEAQRAFIW
ncbi:MAG TPA: hypothetical protein VJQ54_07870, partial [Candidatus Sulfotelmatobacter sp.]|nr:hypothetical protein [Candidatus Sulfotelmatobacter sp.]